MSSKRMPDSVEVQGGAMVSTIADSFVKQVGRTPDAVAVLSGSQQMTYAELDRKSNQLAHKLQELGVRPDVLVGVAVPRSIDMIVSLLAVLKAGGSYVPIDPAFPPQRIALMLQDSNASVIVTTGAILQRLGTVATQVICVDRDSAAIAHYPSDYVASKANGSNLAYVIYTSGSTGKPKGVMIENRNVLNFFGGMDEVIGTEPGVWLAVTSISFDISVLELFWTLSRGFRVVIHGDEGTHTIPSEIRKYGATHLQCTPSLARMIALTNEGLASIGTLRKLLLGGEALPLSLVRHLRQTFSGDLLNMYGPTETTVWSTVALVPQHTSSITIGKPILNTQVYVLDSNMKPVPTGESGDLFIGGDGVVRGYLNRPELTAERFVPDPSRAGNRMYRTGDLARFLPNGDLEFLGRSDFQLKLRGFRIEIGEIETTLEEQPGVGQAVVNAVDFATDEKSEDKRLVAYLIAKPGEKLHAPALREALTQTLPEYMVPSHFVVLDLFPLTANGKVDRKALPRPAAEDKSPEGQEVPRNELEQVIAEVWKDALGVEQVGLNRNFFDLGAHSLLVAEVHIKLQESLGREISLVDLFQFPTVSLLASHIAGASETTATTSANRAARRLAAKRQR